MPRTEADAALGPRGKSSASVTACGFKQTLVVRPGGRFGTAWRRRPRDLPQARALVTGSGIPQRSLVGKDG